MTAPGKRRSGATDGCERRRLGDLLLEDGALDERQLAEGLDRQARSGGRLGEVLAAYGVVPAAALTTALARQLGVGTLRDADEPATLLPAGEWRTWRAVPLLAPEGERGPAPVALADPSPELMATLEERLAGPVEPKLCDEETVDELLARVYADQDAEEVTQVLREQTPDLSAFRTKPSRSQTLVGCVLGFVLLLGLLTDLRVTL